MSEQPEPVVEAPAPNHEPVAESFPRKAKFTVTEATIRFRAQEAARQGFQSEPAAEVKDGE